MADLKPEIPLLLAYYDSKLALLLTLSQTRHGATQVINAGLFPMVRESGLFSVDPDLGICMLDPFAPWDCGLTTAAINSADALGKYYKLLLAVVRVIASVVLSRGPQNQQTIDQAKLFLSENRPLIVAVFKRQARVGAASETSMVDVEELVELLALLMTMTDFIEVSEPATVMQLLSLTPAFQFEDQRDSKRSRRTAFT